MSRPAPARCQSCGLTPADWHPPDEHNIRWAVQLVRQPDNTYRCTVCLRADA